MLLQLKQITLSSLKRVGAFDLLSLTSWRRERLLILCYHGISLEDEHEWYPGLYLTPELFRTRMESLERERCTVVSLQDGVKGLYNGTLPRKSVAITFDDGFHDFHELAFPVLRQHGFPATVYQTTYYTGNRFPVFNLMLDYLFWRAGNRTLDARPLGIPLTFDLEQRGRAVDAIERYAFERNYSAAEKDGLAARIADQLDIDYESLRRRRLLHLMTAEQLREVSLAGMEVELHTHRHRTPMDEDLFVREIRDNREALRRYTGTGPLHFCYPSGVHREEFLPWLNEEGVLSATTCDTGMATRSSDRLQLPRLLDGQQIPQQEFESWLAGWSALLPRRSTDRPVPPPYWESAPQPQRARAASA